MERKKSSLLPAGLNEHEKHSPKNPVSQSGVYAAGPATFESIPARCRGVSRYRPGRNAAGRHKPGLRHNAPLRSPKNSFPDSESTEARQLILPHAPNRGGPGCRPHEGTEASSHLGSANGRPTSAALVHFPRRGWGRSPHSPQHIFTPSGTAGSYLSLSPHTGMYGD